MSQYTKEVFLPSRGLLYSGIPERFVVRNWTTKEEKMIYGSPGEQAFTRVVKACVVEPSTVDVDELLVADKHFLMVQIRILSVGSKYKVEAKCPECNRVKPYVLDLLTDFELHYLDEDFTEPVLCKLPVCGDEVGIRLLRGKDLADIDRKTKRFDKKFPEAVGDQSYVYRLCAYLATKNGVPFPEHEKVKYVESLHGMDTSYIWHVIEGVQVGYDPEVVVTCSVCQADVRFIMPITVEFFRAQFGDGGRVEAKNQSVEQSGGDRIVSG